jgi:hypothetical protein
VSNLAAKEAMSTGPSDELGELMWSTFGVHEPFFHRVYIRPNVNGEERVWFCFSDRTLGIDAAGAEQLMNALNAMQASWMAGLIAKSIERPGVIEGARF